MERYPGHLLIIIMNNLLDKEDYVRKADAIINSVGIPAQPQIISEINNEINKPTADIGTISDMVSKDVSMSAKLLKIINSAFFGLREEVDSIHRALSIMGLRNFNNIILASSLRESLGNNCPELDKFWNHSMAAATIASHIAREVEFPFVDQAYVAGLFHDCGIPIMVKKYPDYVRIIDFALSVVPAVSLSGKSKSIIGAEDKLFHTHHCAIGYLIAKSWHLPAAVSQAIWYHHYIHIDIHKDPSARRLSAILLLADYISSHLLYLSGGKCSVEPPDIWVQIHKQVMSELGLTVDHVKDIKEDLTEKLYN